MRRLAIALFTITVLAAMTLLILWRRSHINFEAHIRTLAGPQAVDCGFVPPSADPSTVDGCALAQFRSQRPFWVRYGQAGIDSRIEWAFMRAGNGELLWLLYDDDISGGGTRLFRKPRILERGCSGRVIEVSLGHQRFTCEQRVQTQQ